MIQINKDATNFSEVFGLTQECAERLLGRVFQSKAYTVGEIGEFMDWIMKLCTNEQERGFMIYVAGMFHARERRKELEDD